MSLTRYPFIGIGAIVTRLTNNGGPSEATTTCWISPSISANHPVDFQTDVIPLDMTKTADRAPWGSFELDSVGVKRNGDPMTMADSSRDGVRVTTFGPSWPKESEFVGAVFLTPAMFQKYRRVIESNGTSWPPAGYRACEFVSTRYSNGARYMGYFGRIISPGTKNGIAKIAVYRAGTTVVAGEWYFNFGTTTEVDPLATADMLNESVGTKDLPSLDVPLQPDMAAGTEGAVYINLNVAARLVDSSEFDYVYGLVGPKIPIWFSK